jgi:hypothetical protein
MPTEETWCHKQEQEEKSQAACDKQEAQMKMELAIGGDTDGDGERREERGERPSPYGTWWQLKAWYTRLFPRAVIYQRVMYERLSGYQER